MPAASNRKWAGLVFAPLLLLGACQDIIGISGYEIDPALGGSASAEGGSASAEGGTGANGGGEPRDEGGSGGQGEAVDTAGASGGPAMGEAGAGGSSHGECERDVDCDDTIDCTEDVCDPSGVCDHRADDAACTPTAAECLSCLLGIGCVETEAETRELLVDGGFDLDEGDWGETSDNYDDILFVEAGAQSGTRIARFGPAPANVKEEYADLLQYVTIPDRTHHLTLTGYYRLAPGTAQPATDYTVAAIYELGETEPSTEFHSWYGDEGVQADWQAFSYDAPRKEVLEMWEREFTFDLVAHTADSVYRFDSLSLTATICQ